MHINSKLQSTHRQYHLASLDKQDLTRDPMDLFRKWFDLAVKKGLLTPDAANLATASKSGTPSSRIVLIKSIDQNKFTFFSSYASQKAKQLQDNPRAELVFYWPSLERQVRISGMVKKLSKQASSEYFHSRPRGSQLAAWTSNQSKPIASRKLLEKTYAHYEKEFKDQEIPLPPNWGGYALQPRQYEFWQGRPNRLNDRFLYKLSKGKWSTQRLQP